MGNWFSNADEERIQREEENRIQQIRNNQLYYNRQIALEKLQAARQEEQRRRQAHDLVRQFQSLSIGGKQDTLILKSVTVDLTLIKSLLQSTEYSDWTHHINNSAYTLDFMEKSSIEYNEIKCLFRKTNKKSFTVTEIEKVFNPYLLMQYKLMEKYYRRRYGYVSEKKLFHGTKRNNISSICENSFDWRLNGKHKFGQGVSFSPISNYATHYSDKTFEKKMIVANVLISDQCLGNRNIIIPPGNYDTTSNENGHVLVKYEDNTFYPAYIIHYQGFEPKTMTPQ